MAVESRSIYSGPIRRSLERLDSRLRDLEATTMELVTRIDRLNADVLALRDRVENS